MGVDFSEINKLTEAVENISASRDEVISQVAKDLAARLLRMVVKRTPAGEGNYHVQFVRTYDAKTGKATRYVKYK